MNSLPPPWEENHLLHIDFRQRWECNKLRTLYRLHDDHFEISVVSLSWTWLRLHANVRKPLGVCKRALPFGRDRRSFLTEPTWLLLVKEDRGVRVYMHRLKGGVSFTE